MDASRSYRVLTIDDDRIVRFIHSGLVTSLNDHRIIHQEAANGIEALEYLNSNGLPDLILLDLNMPLMDGFQFMQEFNRMDFPGKDKTYIVVVSSSNYPEDKNRSFELGVDQYLSKPISIENLRALIEPAYHEKNSPIG
jgi:CheY-like chemotaxis protein